MVNRTTRSLGEYVDKNAARLGSKGGEISNQLCKNTASASYCQTQSAISQLRLGNSFPPDGWVVKGAASARQLFLFELNGAISEPYAPRRTMGKVREVGHAGRK